MLEDSSLSTLEYIDKTGSIRWQLIYPAVRTKISNMSISIGISFENASMLILYWFSIVQSIYRSGRLITRLKEWAKEVKYQIQIHIKSSLHLTFLLISLSICIWHKRGKRKSCSISEVMPITENKNTSPCMLTISEHWSQQM